MAPTNLKDRTTVRPPDDIMKDFGRAMSGQADLSIHDLLGEILEDVVDTVRIALEYHLKCKSDDLVGEVVSETEDYIANYYCDGTEIPLEIASITQSVGDGDLEDDGSDYDSDGEDSDDEF